jgi:uncharacterized protein YutE (UPF0331/DUF86 family)
MRFLDFSKKIASIARSRNALMHESVGINRDRVCGCVQGLPDLCGFDELVRDWTKKSQY